MATLRALDGSKSKAAQVLGISLKTLYNRLHAYGGGVCAPLDALPVDDGSYDAAVALILETLDLVGSALST